MRLCDQHAVEEIGVVRREGADGKSVVQRDWETMCSLCQEVGEALIKGGRQFQSTQP
jgi:hypothetical protein